MKQQEILAALLAKYEKSSHLLEPGKSNRRVMLNIDKAVSYTHLTLPTKRIV